MSLSLIIKAALIWLVIALFAILNGGLRDHILNPVLGEQLAQPLSGITLSLIVFTCTWLFSSFLGKHTATVFLSIGLQWVIMTLLFELIFGHFVMGKSYTELLQVFYIHKGNLFVVALLCSLLSPWLVARLKHSILH